MSFIITENFPITCPQSQTIVGLARGLEASIRNSASPSAEQTLALRKLQEAIYYACVSINRDHKQNQEYEEVSINKSYDPNATVGMEIDPHFGQAIKYKDIFPNDKQSLTPQPIKHKFDTPSLSNNLRKMNDMEIPGDVLAINPNDL